MFQVGVSDKTLEVISSGVVEDESFKLQCKIGGWGMDTLNISDGNYTVFVDQSLTA